MKNTWRFGEREFTYIREVLDSGFGSSTSGNMNNRFEAAFAEKVGAQYAVTFNSGTSTLHAALDAVGVGYGDEVITAPLTVISNLDVILAQNAVPVFADIDPDTFNIDPEDVARKITPKTKAIMPISLYGLSCDLDPLMELGRRHGIAVINDAAEAFGALYKGRPIAEIADITSYSTENSKHITTGDGGIVVTNDEGYASWMRKFGSLGYAALKAKDGRIRNNKDIFQDPTYKRHDAYGHNYRMPEVAAAMGLAQTERMDWFLDIRRRISEMYLEVARDADYLVPQRTPEGCHNSYWTVAFRYERDDVSWQDFRHKYVEFGGDGVYAAWALLYHETLMSSGAWKKRCPPLYDGLDFPAEGTCPNAEAVQPKIMQFVNNYGGLEEAEPKVEALLKTIRHFA
ncbi:MAG: DegT/DnrJ/EryC1/StrS family aminotransferase [Marivibrio sp.]|uniref:DegT/DnrJ/EryC1/StrS family aminotransferase n=1 Tax=Marivibrio sp. TaxID=2039719 RepID=UPI0032EEA379